MRENIKNMTFFTSEIHHVGQIESTSEPVLDHGPYVWYWFPIVD